MKNKNYEVNVSLVYTEEDIENLVVTALEGGIGYWACLDNDTPLWEKYDAAYPDEPCSIIATKMLLDNEYLKFTDAETGEEFEGFDIRSLMSGIKLYIQSGNPVSNTMDDMDGESADMIWQYGMFGELVYG